MSTIALTLCERAYFTLLRLGNWEDRNKPSCQTFLSELRSFIALCRGKTEQEIQEQFEAMAISYNKNKETEGVTV